MAQSTGNHRNILVGASPLFLSVEDSTTSGYNSTLIPASHSTSNTATPTAAVAATASRNTLVPAFKNGAPLVVSPAQAYVAGESYINTLNAIDATPGVSSGTPAVITAGNAYRNVGFTNNGLQITYNPSYGSVTVDQLLDTAKLFKESMEVMIATEMAEGTLENVLAVFGQSSTTLSGGTLGLAAGALGEAPVERQLIAVGQAPTTDASSKTERVYYGRRVLSVQQSQFSLARNAASTFPVTFRLLPSGVSSHAGSEYGIIVDRTWN
jgi:hypothetical protein